MNYYIDLWSWRTWKEFRDAGATVSGFNARKAGFLTRIKPGDIFLCYMTVVMRWVGALRVIGPSDDKRRIWKDKEFPVRFQVEPMIILDPEVGIPMELLEGRVQFFAGPEDRGKYKGFVRASPARFQDSKDGDLILALLEDAKRNPKPRPIDPIRLKSATEPAVWRLATVSIGESGPQLDSVRDNSEADEPLPSIDEATQHSIIQHKLAEIGSELDMKVWIPKYDRSKIVNGSRIDELVDLLDKLPPQFDEETSQVIRNIDVMWINANKIEAAFEVESTTSIYSGLLRMADLVALQPNTNIPLFIVAPDERRAKVKQEMRRPVFDNMVPALSSICGYLSFSKLVTTIDFVKKSGVLASLKPDFVENIAEFFGDDVTNEV